MGTIYRGKWYNIYIMGKKRYGKLVRDKIPEIIRSDNKIPNTRVMDKDEYRRELLYKLIEESEEVRKAGYFPDDAFKVGSQVADLIEVLYSVIDEFNLDEEEVDRLRMKKLEERGGFTDKIFLESVID